MRNHLFPSRLFAAQIRHNLQAFLAGGTAALAFGFYQVDKDVWKAAELVDARLDSVSREAVSAQAALQERVVALEGELTKLKGELRSNGGSSS